MSKVNDSIHKYIKNTLYAGKIPKIIEEHRKKYSDFRDELDKESDRGCALLAAAHLDYKLEILLRSKLVGNNKHYESLFGVSGPVGTFSSRILLSYSIGLISKDVLHDIQIIRKIRNQFAHVNYTISFDNKKYQICATV